MAGIKFAAFVVGAAVLGTALVYLIVAMCFALFGAAVGGPVALGIVVVLLFAVIAIVTNIAEGGK